MQSSILLIASAAALAAATARTTNIHARSLALFRRQDSTPSAECLSAAIDLVSSIPTPAADVLAYLATAPDSVTSDPCRITFPASLSSEVEDWVTSPSAFSSESASALSSIISECGGTEATDLGAGVCASEPAFVYVNGGASGTAAATSAQETGSSGAAPTTAGGAATTRSTAASASESTGAAATTAGNDSGAADRLPFGAAVVAVAGVVGLVAAL
ncbi:hypothetical protein HYQ44_007192 [Verticillium longisporum]|nr:hypothetical protein HYQ44_007192 [Verticillium longisporum]